ncbi:MAG: hypothetical protein QXU92_04410 [Candidatus Diapherotrites archaeon]
MIPKKQQPYNKKRPLPRTAPKRPPIKPIKVPNEPRTITVFRVQNSINKTIAELLETIGKLPSKLNPEERKNRIKKIVEQTLIKNEQEILDGIELSIYYRGDSGHTIIPAKSFLKEEYKTKRQKNAVLKEIIEALANYFLSKRGI